jgi:hypothetical protein
MLEVPHLSACDRVVPLLVDEVAVGFLGELGLYLAQLRVRQIVIYNLSTKAGCLPLKYCSSLW